MGTRGAYGFRVNKRDIIAYNHFDSYYEGLGADILAQAKEIFGQFPWRKEADIKKVRERVAKLKVVGDPQKPTAADIKALEPYTDLGVSKQSTSDWYCLTRKMQGNIKASFDSGYFPGSAEKFLSDSLFCEYAYILNLDDGTLEVYEGFNKDPKAAGRYAKLYDKPAHREKVEYYGVRLVKAYPLDALPEDFSELEEKEEQEA